MKFLQKKGYKCYGENVLNSAVHWQRVIESESVCDLNEKLFINIYEFDMSNVEPSRTDYQYEVDLAAEKNERWWKLRCYSLNRVELENELTSIEEQLVKLFNMIGKGD